MDGKRVKVVCHLHIGGDLKKEMKPIESRVGAFPDVFSSANSRFTNHASNVCQYILSHFTR